MRLSLAIDMWSAGMIFLFFLTGKFPLFQSNDDVEALLEIACIIGRRRMEKAATLHCARLLEAQMQQYINWILQPEHSPRISHPSHQKGSPGVNSWRR
jgi:serine/threonine protein kinase